MMDEMKLKLSSRFMRKVVSKMIARAIRKKHGYDVDIQLHELDVSVIDGETNIKTNVEIKLNSDTFMKIMKSIDMD